MDQNSTICIRQQLSMSPACHWLTVKFATLIQKCRANWSLIFQILYTSCWWCFRVFINERIYLTCLFLGALFSLLAAASGWCWSWISRQQCKTCFCCAAVEFGTGPKSGDALQCCQGLKARGQGLEVRGQRLVNWSLRILKDKDFPWEQQHWVTVKNGLLTVVGEDSNRGITPALWITDSVVYIPV